MPPSLAVLVSVLLVFANAFFVAAEFSLVKMRTTRLEQLAAEGSLRAGVALAISSRLDSYLAAAQLGITLASLGLGWIGEPAFAALLTPPLSLLGAWSSGAVHTLATLASLATVTFLHAVLGELVPKSLAMRRTEPLALWTAAPLRAFYVATFPLIWLLAASARLALRLVGVDPSHPHDLLHSPEELRLILERAVLEPGSRRALDRALDEERRVAEHAMTPRSAVVALDVDARWASNLKVAFASPHTHYPLVEGSTDRVLGFVHLKDIVAALGSSQPPVIGELVREPIYADERTPIGQLRDAFSLRGVHLAVLTSPGLRFCGIVTLSDVLEEADYGVPHAGPPALAPPLVRRSP